MTREEAIKVLDEYLYSTGEVGGVSCVVAFDAGLDDTEEALGMAIAALREQPRWIPVEERLPEESGRYIVLRKSGDCLDCCYEKDRGSWGVLIDMGESGALWVAYNGVTHWMPLPEPPEEEV